MRFSNNCPIAFSPRNGRYSTTSLQFIRIAIAANSFLTTIIVTVTKARATITVALVTRSQGTLENLRWHATILTSGTSNRPHVAQDSEYLLQLLQKTSYKFRR